jgi:hypothetical protein
VAAPKAARGLPAVWCGPEGLGAAGAGMRRLSAPLRVEVSGVKDLRAQPWWTDADRAELDAIVHELVAGVYSHDCATCIISLRPCAKVQRAIAIAIEWRDARVLLSRARWERFHQDLFEFEQELR